MGKPFLVAVFLAFIMYMLLQSSNFIQGYKLDFRIANLYLKIELSENTLPFH